MSLEVHQYLGQVHEMGDVWVLLHYSSQAVLNGLLLDGADHSWSDIYQPEESFEHTIDRVLIIVADESHPTNQQPHIGVVHAEHPHEIVNAQLPTDNFEAQAISERYHVLEHGRRQDYHDVWVVAAVCLLPIILISFISLGLERSLQIFIVVLLWFQLVDGLFEF